MWAVTGLNLNMTEQDYGVQLPVEVRGAEFGPADTIKLVIKEKMNGPSILEKDFTNLSENIFNLVLTQAESNSLPVGDYVYRLDWYNNGSFMDCLVERSHFKVVDKA